MGHDGLAGSKMGHEYIFKLYAVNDSFSYMVKNENNVIHSTRCDISSDLTPGAQFLKNYNENHELIRTFRNYAFIK